MNSRMIRPSIFNLQILKNVLNHCYTTKAKTGILSELEVEDEPSYSIEPKYNEYELKIMMNKSGLSSNHENILKGKKPYPKSKAWYHDSIRYRKKMLGKYGVQAANITPAIAWPTEDDIEDAKEFERTLYPVSIQEALKIVKEKNKIEALQIKQREEDIDKALANVDKWKTEMKAKLHKKLFERYKLKIRKQRRIENLREKYGYKLSVREARIKENELKAEAENKKMQEKKTNKLEKNIAFIKRQEKILEKQSKASKENVN